MRIYLGKSHRDLPGIFDMRPISPTIKVLIQVVDLGPQYAGFCLKILGQKDQHYFLCQAEIYWINGLSHDKLKGST